MELSGNGYKIWREERFPKVTRALFKRLMQDMDSQLEDSSQGEPISDGETEICGHLDKPIREAESKQTTDVNVAPNWNSAPNSNIAPSGNAEPSSNAVVHCNAVALNEQQNGDPDGTYDQRRQVSFASAQSVNCVRNSDTIVTLLRYQIQSLKEHFNIRQRTSLVLTCME